MNNVFFQRAIGIVNEAIEADRAKDYKKAYDLYKNSLGIFMTGLKYEKNPKVAEVIRLRVEGYLQRAEQLQEAMGSSESRERAAPAPVGASASGSKEGEEEDEKEDAETAKMRAALQSVIVTERPNITWDMVAGLEAAKDKLQEAVILPARFPELFVGKRRPWKGILLYGPPGTGKSYLAKAVATEAKSTFYSVSSSDLVSKWQGESEKLVKMLFQLAAESTPAVIFIDEIDSLCSARGDGESESSRRIKTEFLVQMQGVGKGSEGVLVLGATNLPWAIDSAMRRRFDKRVYIPLPATRARQRMFEIHLGDTPHTLSESDFAELGTLTEGYSGSDISVVVKDALFQPVTLAQSSRYFVLRPDGLYEPREAPSAETREMSIMDVPDGKLFVRKVSMADFRRALRSSSASVAPDELVRYEEWTRTFGMEGS